MAKRIEDLSDDEVAAMTPEQFAALDTETPANDGDPDPENTEPAPKDEPAAETTAEEANDEAEPEPEELADDENQPNGGKATGKEPAKAPAEDPKAAGGEKKVGDKPADDKAEEVDYKKQLDALYAPFKANGRDMQVANVEEARQLMQMGANYNKKMAAMKPHLATLRMLENAQITPERLSFLIDVHKKDPAAINKLVTDSGIDPMDLSADKAAGYKPGNHRPSDTEVELEAVIQELDGSKGFERTLDVVTNKLDPRSKKIVAENPGLIKLINSHIESGHYDAIQTEIDRQRMFGQLAGLSDLEAYRQVGDAMHAAGKFAHLEAGQPSQGQRTADAPVVVTPDPKKAEDENKRKEARRAVAPVKAANGGTKRNADFNPLAMSDEEFMKQFK